MAKMNRRPRALSRSAIPAGTDAGTPDLLSIVEAAYSMDGPSRAWMGRLLEAAERSIGEGLGGFASIFNANPDGTIAIDRDSAAVVHQPEEVIHAIFDGLTHAPPGWLSAYIN